RTRLERAQHAAAGRPVDVQAVADPDEYRRDHDRRAVEDRCDVTEQRFVQDRLEYCAVVPRALGETLNPRPLGGRTVQNNATGRVLRLAPSFAPLAALQRARRMVRPR